MFSSPLNDRLQSAGTILIAGCGGGFDIYCGIPLAVNLAKAGKQVVLASFSFTALARSGGEHIQGPLWRVRSSAAELPYFPEKWLCEWMARQEIDLPVYAISLCGVRPLHLAFNWLHETYAVDLVVLVDGGTDSLIFGDEPGLGTVAEDAVSLIAANEVAAGKAILATIGFGIDHHHGISHHAFLENVATITRDRGFLGRACLTSNTVEADLFLDLVDYANQRQPEHPSIVGNSIASALRGEFGDFHATKRTANSELFISSLMIDYWAFDIAPIVTRMQYADALANTQSIENARTAIELFRQTIVPRPRNPIPL